MEEPLSVRVVILFGELFVESCIGWGVDSPAGSMGNHEAGKPPVIEFLEKGFGSVSPLKTVEGEFAHGYIRRAKLKPSRLPGEAVEVEIGARCIQVPYRHSETQQGPERRGDGRFKEPAASGTDRPSWNPALLGIPEDDILVSVVVTLASAINGSGLGPFPAKKGHRVRVFGLGDGVAFADGFPGFLPLARRQGLGVIIDGPEVEARAEAREVTGIGWRMGAFALEEWKTEYEGIA